MRGNLWWRFAEGKEIGARGARGAGVEGPESRVEGASAPKCCVGGLPARGSGTDGRCLRIGETPVLHGMARERFKVGGRLAHRIGTMWARRPRSLNGGGAAEEGTVAE